MSLANLDGSYARKVRDLAQRIVTLTVGASDQVADAEEPPPADGYLRFYMGPNARNRSHCPPNVPWQLGMVSRDLEHAILRRLEDLAVDRGTIWIEALYTSETAPFDGARLHSQGDSRIDVLSDIADQRGGHDALMLAHAQVVHDLRGAVVMLAGENVRLAGQQVDDSFSLGRMSGQFDSAKELGAAESHAATLQAIGPELVRQLGNLLSPMIHAKFAGGGDGDGEELPPQPEDFGEERLAWDLDLAESLVRDMVAHVQVAPQGFTPAIQQRMLALYAQLQGFMAPNEGDAGADA